MLTIKEAVTLNTIIFYFLSGGKMKLRLQHKFIVTGLNILTKTVVAVIIAISFNLPSYTQEIYLTEETEISGGAEYSIFLENMMNKGKGWMLKYNLMYSIK